MTTSDPVGSGDSALESRSPIDLAWLARAANELFAAQPGSIPAGSLPGPLSSPSPSATGAPALALAPALAHGAPAVQSAAPISPAAVFQKQALPPVTGGVLGEDDLRALLRGMESVLALVPQASLAPRASGVGAIAPQLGEVERNAGVTGQRRFDEGAGRAPVGVVASPAVEVPSEVQPSPSLSSVGPRSPQGASAGPSTPPVSTVGLPASPPIAATGAGPASHADSLPLHAHAPGAFEFPALPTGLGAPAAPDSSAAVHRTDATPSLRAPAGNPGLADSAHAVAPSSRPVAKAPTMLPPSAEGRPAHAADPKLAAPDVGGAPRLNPPALEPFAFQGVPAITAVPHVPLAPHGGVAPDSALAALQTAGTSVPGATAAESLANEFGSASASTQGQDRPLIEPFAFQPDMLPAPAHQRRALDPNLVRRDFPILAERVHGKPLVWFDNAATTQKPRAVIERLRHFYEHENSNIHRAAHALAARATDAYEGAREKVRRFLNASTEREIVFVRGATEGLNLVAKALARPRLQKGDEIVLTWLEHHANIVPWQQLCAETGAKLRVVPVDDDGQVILEEYEKLLGPRTQVVSMTHVSNALGTIVPVRKMIAMAHRHGALTVVDAAQSVSHMRVDVQQLDCDVLVFSGHKLFAPTGIGVVWARTDLLENSPPWQGGGNMIADVRFERTVYQPPPARFEAGTGNIADAVGLGAAIDYLEDLGMDAIGAYEHELLAYATERLKQVPRLRLIGTARDKASVLSFVLAGLPTEQVGAALDKEGIAVRSGHHCAQPILRRFGLEATVRPSLAFYNTREEVDLLVRTLLRIESEARAQGR